MKNFKEFLNESREKINHKLVDLKILNEMSTICRKKDGFGFIAQIYSNDHNPPHIHISDTDGKELGQIYITNKIPQKIEDILVYKGNVDKVIDKIVEWANRKSKYLIMNWNRAKQTGEDNHSDDEVKFK